MPRRSTRADPLAPWPLLLAFLLLFLAAPTLTPAQGADQPQWGEWPTRNLVSNERNLPASFDPKSGQNIRWTAKLGTESHSTPVVANGRVFIGANNGEPRDPKYKGDRGVLMCFDESDGRFLWQLVVPKREEDPYYDWPNSGISSPASVENDRVYIVSNRGEVLCLDAHGLANGNDGPYLDEAKDGTRTGDPRIELGPTDADILWKFDLVSGAGIWSHDAAHSSILIDGPFLYLNTGTGVDSTHRRIRLPDAPSFVVLDKMTGRLLARERENIGPNIFHCTWASPSIGTINGQRLVFFAAGNGFVYAFEPLRSAPAQGEVATLKKVWQFDFDPAAPKSDVHRFNSNRREGPSNLYGMPVPFQNRIYIAGGGDLFWGKNEAWLKCIDASGRGDITASALVWSYPLVRHTVSTVAIYGNLVFVSDVGRTVHCVDAQTGRPYWTHEAKGDFWASPLVADGKVYIGSRRGDFWVFAAEATKKILSSVDLGSPISATATAANQTLYIATMTRLYAVGK